MTRFVDLIEAILTTWSNFGKTPPIIKLHRETKRRAPHEGIQLRDSTDEIVLASNGSLIYANRNGTIEIYANNQIDVDNLYTDLIANFVGKPIVYNDVDQPDKRNKYKIFLECTYLEK
jgi:hypothetical protein